MEDQEIDFNLLRTLLQPRTKIQEEGVRKILYGGDAEDFEDDLVLKQVVRLLKRGGYTTYGRFKSTSEDNLKDYIARRKGGLPSVDPKGDDEEILPATLDALMALRRVLRTTIPESIEGDANLNLIDESDSIVLPGSPSNFKLSHAESSVLAGLFVQFSLTKGPLSFPAHATGIEAMNFFVENGVSDLSGMLTEGTYTMQLIGYPACMVAKSADSTAKTVMPENYTGGGKRRKLIQANPQSKPELAAGIAQQGHPPKSDEWKSFPSEGIEEIINTSIGHLQSSFFREEEGGQSWKFYEKPPWGLAFLSCACSTICVFSYEVVGVLHYSIYAGGCTVGSSTYKEHISFLDEVEVQIPVVNLLRVPLTQCTTVKKRVQWTLEPLDGFFYKIIRYDLFSKEDCPEHGIARADNWRRLFSVYDKYRRICDTQVLPNALVSACLLYGEFQVAVKMNFICGTAPADDSSASPQDTDDLCEALVFLGKQGFIYTDFRPQNVIRANSDGRIRLIDYDDMKIVSQDRLKGEYEMISAKTADTGFGQWVKEAIAGAIALLEH